MVEEISLLIRKLPKNTLFNLVVGRTKTRKLVLSELKIKHNVLYCETTSYNYSPNGIDSSTFISTPSTKKSFLFFMYLWSVGKNLRWQSKNSFYHNLLRWRLCYFSHSMVMLVFHTCSNQKPSHTQWLVLKSAYVSRFYIIILHLKYQ